MKSHEQKGRIRSPAKKVIDLPNSVSLTDEITYESRMALIEGVRWGADESVVDSVSIFIWNDLYEGNA